MAIETVKYIRKPLYVDAVRVTSANFEEIADWCQGEIQTDEEEAGKKFIKVRVHNPKNPRQTKAFVGDWLLYTERGYKVYTNKAFHSSFDKAEDLSEPIIPDEPYPVPDPDYIHNGIEAETEMTPPKDEQMPSEPSGVVDTEVPVMPITSSTVEADGEVLAPPSHVGSKRVLTEKEQREMDRDELRELLQSGEFILEQDLATS